MSKLSWVFNRCNGFVNTGYINGHANYNNVKRVFSKERKRLSFIDMINYSCRFCTHGFGGLTRYRQLRGYHSVIFSQFTQIYTVGMLVGLCCAVSLVYMLDGYRDLYLAVGVNGRHQVYKGKDVLLIISVLVLVAGAFFIGLH